MGQATEEFILTCEKMGILEFGGIARLVQNKQITNGVDLYFTLKQLRGMHLKKVRDSDPSSLLFADNDQLEKIIAVVKEKFEIKW